MDNAEPTEDRRAIGPGGGTRAFFVDLDRTLLPRASGAPVVPVGLWGTDAVWPRRARVLDVRTVARPSSVRVRVGEPMTLGTGGPGTDTAAVTAAISALLPPEARVPRHPTSEELAGTYPPGAR